MALLASVQVLLFERRGVERLIVEVPLDVIGSQRAHHAEHFLGLDALHAHGQVHAVAQIDDARHDALVVHVVGDALQKAAGHLELVGGDDAEQVQRRVAGSEIVEGHAEALAAQEVERAAKIRRVGDHAAFRELQHDVPRLDAMAFRGLHDAELEGRVVQHVLRKVDVHDERGVFRRPARGLLERFVHKPRGGHADEPAFLQVRYELERRHAFGEQLVAPAHEHFAAVQLFGLRVHDGLVAGGEPLESVGYAGLKRFHEKQRLVRRFAEFGRAHGATPPASALGVDERNVQVAVELVGGQAVVGVNADAARNLERHNRALDGEPRCRFSEHAREQRAERVGVDDAGDDGAVAIAVELKRFGVFGKQVAHELRQLVENQVAERVRVQVVDAVEVVDPHG